ncbi:uncharacterized protein LOC121052876 [Rosa chinensis]|uniref:uncharacterized protein LOC121052876 n=1 Tax=Rosa chinensis TaxID=74649 RepID=UPI001AD90136|nr:uncharacterized protein LOC121052876 [Rosa chinensis]
MGLSLNLLPPKHNLLVNKAHLLQPFPILSMKPASLLTIKSLASSPLPFLKMWRVSPLALIHQKGYGTTSPAISPKNLSPVPQPSNFGSLIFKRVINLLFHLQQAKSIDDSLASINQPVSDADLVVATLHGLGPDYLMLRTALAQSSSLPDFSDLRARILAFEAQQTQSLDSTTTADLFHHGSNPAALPRALTQDATAQPRGPSPRRECRRPSYGGRNNQRYRRGGGARSQFQNFAFNPNANFEKREY